MKVCHLRQRCYKCLFTLNMSLVNEWSNTADRGVEEDAAREVSIAPLCEGCLLFEIPLDCWEILLLKDAVIVLIGRAEVIVV